MHLKLLRKDQFKKLLKQLVIWLVIKLLIKSQNLQKNSLQNNSETVRNEEENVGHDRDIQKEKCISLEKTQQIINDLRLI